MVDSMRCLLVTKREDGKVERAITTRPTSDLPPGDVVVRVRYSSLNYKDALGCTGHSGVVNKFPHVPGIDAAGVVEESTSPKFTAGAEVLVTGFELGAPRWGGYAEFIRVPADWVRAAAKRLEPARKHGNRHGRIYGSSLRASD